MVWYILTVTNRTYTQTLKHDMRCEDDLKQKLVSGVIFC